MSGKMIENMNAEQLDRYAAELTLANARKINTSAGFYMNGIERQYADYARQYFNTLANQADADLAAETISLKERSAIAAMVESAISDLTDALYNHVVDDPTPSRSASQPTIVKNSYAERIMRITLDDAFAVNAYVDPAERWNGWLCPSFTYEQALILVQKWNADPHFLRQGKAYYNADADSFNFPSDYDSSDDFKGYETESGKRYAIGAYCWVWDQYPYANAPILPFMD